MAYLATKPKPAASAWVWIPDWDMDTTVGFAYTYAKGDIKGYQKLHL